MNNEDISGIIKGIMQNPEFSKIVEGVRGEKKGGGEASTDEIMSKLPEVMAMLSPLLSEGTSDGKSAPKVNLGGGGTSAIEKIAGKYDRARGEKLLKALKPYLNKERCEIIDKCVSVMQLGDGVGSFGALEGLVGNTKEKGE